ncbi:MAG: hypothetical protein ACFCBW_04815 [Candidatus Competibacterales bacterium]
MGIPSQQPPPRRPGHPGDPQAKRRRKRRLVRDVWLYSATLMLFLSPATAAALALGTIFVSFMILDETS